MNPTEQTPIADAVQRAAGQTDVQKLLQLFSDFYKALLRRDGAALEKIIADDYTLVDETGRTIDREKMIENVSTGKVVFNELSRRDNMMQLYGDNAAVWISVVTVRTEVKGREVNGRYRDAATFLKTASGWRLAATHLTPA